MDLKHHHGWSHGLRPGTDHDINCMSCRIERKAEQGDRESTVTAREIEATERVRALRDSLKAEIAAIVAKRP